MAMAARVGGRGRVRYGGIAGHDNLKSVMDTRGAMFVHAGVRALERSATSGAGVEQTKITRVTIVNSYHAIYKESCEAC